jgi:hypothetical protein
MPAYRLAEEAPELDPEDKEAWEYLRKDGRTKCVLFFGTGNAVPKPCGVKKTLY